MENQTPTITKIEVQNATFGKLGSKEITITSSGKVNAECLSVGIESIQDLQDLVQLIELTIKLHQSKQA